MNVPLINKRIEPLDWLRAILAVSIMLFHLKSWSNQTQDSSHILTRLAFGGVSMFFVLSGLCITLIYQNLILDKKQIFQFYISRLIRIWPLFWVVSILALLLSFLNNEKINQDWETLFFNFTTLYGFTSSIKTFVTGGWTIGNEIVFYLITPFIISLYNYKKKLGNLFFGITLLLGLYYSFYVFKSTQSLDNQWSIFIKPVNQLSLFTMGIAIYYNFTNITINSKIIYGLLFISVIMFCCLPFKGDEINIVSGIGRLIYITIYFIIVLCFYKLPLKLPSHLNTILIRIGTATFGIYLLHPIIKGYSIYFIKLFFSNSTPNYNHPIINLFVIICTIFLSIISYYFFELRIIKIGKAFFMKRS